MLKAQRTGNTMGAEVTGADLSRPLGDAGFKEIQEIFLRHQVVVFRGQRLSSPQFLSFARHFGPPEPHVLDQFHHS